MFNWPSNSSLNEFYLQNNFGTLEFKQLLTYAVKTEVLGLYISLKKQCLQNIIRHISDINYDNELNNVTNV